MTELQKRFEADAYKQKMNYAGSAGIAAEQGFLAGIDFLQQLLQQNQCNMQCGYKIYTKEEFDINKQANIIGLSSQMFRGSE